MLDRFAKNRVLMGRFHTVPWSRLVLSRTQVMRTIPLILLLVASVFLAGCSLLVQKVDASPERIYGDPSDGVVTSTGGINEGASGVWIGDERDPPNVAERAFVKFSVSGVSGILSSARLNLFLRGSYRDGASSPPLDNPGLGDCLIRHIADYGVLNGADFNAPSIGNDPGVFISGTATPNVGYISIDVKGAVQDDRNNGRAFSTFMIKMAIDTDGDNQVDRWEITSSDSAGPNRPYIEYTVRTLSIPTTMIATGILFTDWALSNPTLSPSSPRDGDSVTFRVILQALSTTLPYPQGVKVVASLDGISIAGGSLNYLGPTGNSMTVSSSPPWTAREGTHMVTWVVDPSPYAYNDPNRVNNEASLTFTVGPAAPTAVWDLSVIPDFGNIAPGGRTTFTVQVTGASGGASIQLIQSPPVLGISVSFSVNNQPAPFESIMTVSVDPSKPEGIYPIEVWAHPSDTSFPGPDNKMKAIKVVVGAPPPAFDFSISASPPTQTVTAGKSASYIITISLVAGAAQPVTLDLTGLPPYVTYTFNPSSSNPTFQSTLEVVTSASTTPGTYRLNMTASGGEVTRTASLMLEIQAQRRWRKKEKPHQS